MMKTISRAFDRSRNQKGFTLVELMVVVVILGVLAALVVPTLSGQIDKAKINRTYADMKSIQNALQLHFADNNQYPAASGTAVPALPNYGLAAIPTDAWGQPFWYETVTDAAGRRTQYNLYSSGPNGTFDGANSDDLAATHLRGPGPR
ncbi:MAG: prepilin-type N-terminal cleavage/methylation domain-containing protein [Bacillota bacterium]